MEAEMYGIIFSAKIDIRDKAPPVKALNIPSNPPLLLEKKSFKTDGLIPGKGT